MNIEKVHLLICSYIWWSELFPQPGLWWALFACSSYSTASCVFRPAAISASASPAGRGSAATRPWRRATRAPRACASTAARAASPPASPPPAPAARATRARCATRRTTAAPTPVLCIRYIALYRSPTNLLL